MIKERVLQVISNNFTYPAVLDYQIMPHPRLTAIEVILFDSKGNSRSIYVRRDEMHKPDHALVEEKVVEEIIQDIQDAIDDFNFESIVLGNGV